VAGAGGEHPPLSARELQRRIADDWRVTSYSGLQQHGFSSGQDLLPRLDIDAAGVGEVVEEPQLTRTSSRAAPRRGPSCTACLRSWTLPSRCRTDGWRRNCS
jgi:exodeoxyribonuclease V beta subunit